MDRDGSSRTADSLRPRRGAPIVETTAGKVRGAATEGVYAFKGIPYAAPPIGPDRFRPPQKPAPWAGVRDARRYGHMAIQVQPPPGFLSFVKFMPRSTVWQGLLNAGAQRPSEDCLVLNVWTPGLDDGKRPVLVWCHGGGFLMGSGSIAWSDGTNLARVHDVVVVSSNHRLGIFGYLHLGDFGDERFAGSGNAGMLDIVAVLEWVRDNIAAFGGDPDCVTVFGESGGGQKVSALMAMPAAEGLFQRAIVESGSFCRAVPAEKAARTARAVLAALDLAPDQLDALQRVPARRLSQALRQVGEGDLHPAKAIGVGTAFQPVLDGGALPRHPFEPDAPPGSAHVPLIVGTNRDDGCIWGLLGPSRRVVDMASLRDEVRMLGVPEAEVEPTIAAFRAPRPDASPRDLYFAVATELTFRTYAIRQAERKAAQDAAPAYMYLFTWASPDPDFKSGHALEWPFVFDNLHLARGLGAPEAGPQMQELADRMSAAWVAFARSGDPNGPGLPEWQPYDARARATMIWNQAPHLVYDPLRGDRLAAARLSPWPRALD